MDRLKSFPQDGRLYWIRWVDDVRTPFGSTDSPGLFVLLSPLADTISIDKLPFLEHESRRGDKAFRTCFALVGSPPGLAIGTVFRNGVRVGQLQAQEVTFTFEKLQSHLAIRCANDRAKFAFPRWPELRAPLPLVPRSRYPLPEFHGGNCLVIHDADQAAIFPCFEVFRSFYAPHQEIALALTRGPWDLTWPDVANPDDTRRLDDGAWQIGLRPRIRNEHAPVLANLILNPVGREAANKIYASLLRSKQTPETSQAMLSLGGEDEEPEIPIRGNKTAFPLLASIPFNWSTLAIKARCACWRESPRQYFAFEITEITWPDAPLVTHRIDYDRDNSGRTGDSQVPLDQPPPYIRAASELHLAESEPVPVTVDEDPRPEPSSVLFPVRGPAWMNTPPLRPVVKLISFSYEAIQRLMEPEPVTEVSAGLPGSASSDAMRAQYFVVPRPPLPHRFGQVIDALTQLEQANKIAGWRVVCPPQDGIEYRGGILAWPVSQRENKKGWCWIDQKLKRMRGALICEVYLGGATLLWLELETRTHTEGFWAVIWCRTDLDCTGVICELLRVATDKNGVWPRAEAGPFSSNLLATNGHRMSMLALCSWSVLLTIRVDSLNHWVRTEWPCGQRCCPS